MACKINLKFSNGDKVPVVGLGTWRAPSEEVESALNEALELGYRHIDTAPVYLNEKSIGKVLKSWIDSGRISREELFIVTKLPPFGNRASSVEKYLRRSLEDLQLDYIDLYLIHCPFSMPESDGPPHMENGKVIFDQTDHISTWKEFERLQAAGLIKHIGVSNFNKRQIQNLLDNCTVKPENLQIELHIYLQQHELVDFCKKNDILVTAYSPLGSKGIDKLLGKMGVERQIPDFLKNPEVLRIAEKLEKTAAQILLKFLLQRGVMVIPKSTSSERLKENINLFNFQIDESDMENLRNLDQNLRVCDFAFFPGIDGHPEFPFAKRNQEV